MLDLLLGQATQPMADYLLDLPWPFTCPICGPHAPIYGNICLDCSVSVRILPRHCLLFICRCLETSCAHAAQMMQRWMHTRASYVRPGRAATMSWTSYHHDYHIANKLIAHWNNQYVERFRLAVRTRWTFRFDALKALPWNYSLCVTHGWVSPLR